jgi:hypothetical protein
MDLRPDWLALGVDRVLAGQGIDPLSASARLAPLRAAAADALAAAPTLLAPAVAIRRVEVSAAAETSLTLSEGGTRLEGRALVELLKGASELVFAVCTVGDAVSRRASAAMADDPVAGLALEGLACAAVDALCAEVCAGERLHAADRGLRVTAPVSPGLEGWPLDAGQQAIFALVDAAAIGVRLSRSFQMQPTKSASFVLGVGRQVPAHDGGSCARCGASGHCGWRTARERSAGGM